GIALGRKLLRQTESQAPRRNSGGGTAVAASRARGTRKPVIGASPPLAPRRASPPAAPRPAAGWPGIPESQTLRGFRATARCASAIRGPAERSSNARPERRL